MSSGLRLAVLTGLGTGASVRDLAVGRGLVVEPAASTDDVVALVDAGRADVVLLLTGESGGWPVTQAERLAVALRGRVPLIVVCDAPHDGELIRRRIGGPTVTVFARSLLSDEDLIDAAEAAILSIRAAPDDAAP